MFNLSENGFDAFCSVLVAHAIMLDDVPHVFDFERDPNDAHYIDLAVAAKARLVVSRDKDILSLRDVTTNDGRNFAARFPEIIILTPSELIRHVESTRSG
jgi:predicted nucleic acid-binding protein